MFGRNLAFEVVQESDYTDFSDRYEKEKPSNSALLGVGIAATASLSTYAITKIINTTANPAAIPPPLVSSTPIQPIIEPIIAQAPSIPPEYMLNPEMMPVGLIGETSINLLTNIMDPVIQLLVAISLPVSSVIMIGACFFFMFGQPEKAWTTIMNSGLGFILIQLSPMFLEILKEIGKAL